MTTKVTSTIQITVSSLVPFVRDTYAHDFGEGAKVLRPYHLSWRSDFGLSSLIEPDVMVMLAEVILAHGQGSQKDIWHGVFVSTVLSGTEVSNQPLDPGG